MASGTISLGTSGAILGQIVWSSSSNGVSKNSSQVTASIQVRKTNNTTQSTTGTWTGNLSINNDTRTFSIRKEVSKNAWVTLSSFTLTVSHKSDGTGTCQISGRIQGPAGTTQSSSVVSGSQTVTLDKIDRYATITSAPNFTDIQNPNIQYSNPAGSNVTSLQACISLTGSNDDVPYRDISVTGSSYTFNLTDSERNTLRQATPNSNTLIVYFYIKTVLSGSTFYQNKAVTMTIVNGNPTFSAAYLDTNSTTTAITGNNQQIIQNNSTLQINITNATALKYASLRSVSANVNGNTISGTFSSGSSSITLNVGTIDVANNLSIPITVTDSRGNTTTNTLTVQVLAWSLPTAIITLARVSNYYTETNLTVNADYSSLNNKNTITIQYQIKKESDSTYGALTTIQDDVQTQFNADNNYSWNVKVILTDKIGSTTYNLFLYKGIPLMFWDRLLSSIGVNCFPSNQYSIESSGLPVDDLKYIGSQTLYDSYTMTTANIDTVLGAYDYGLIDGVFSGIDIPSGYEKAYRLTAQGSTNGSNQLCVSVGGIKSSLINTWSGTTYRKVTATRIFKQSELTLEPTYNYTSKNGLNLKCHNSATGEAYFYNITIHGYLVKTTTSLTSSQSLIDSIDAQSVEEA